MRISLFIIIIFTLLVAPFTARALSIVPNDPHFTTQYYTHQIHADEAWGYSVGSKDVVIAVIDAGVDIDHPDLKDQIWINGDEIAGNNIDDDKNGFIDDRNGWNFVENNPDTRPQFNDYTIEGASHGTLVAGIISATGNNKEGIAGVSWQSKIMPIRALNSVGEGEAENATAAIRYAVENGAHIINLSFVGGTFNQDFYNAIRYAFDRGVLVVAAIGNDAAGSTTKLSGGNLDERPSYPACFGSAKEQLVIGVGAVDKNNIKTEFSNFGKTCIDLNAPAVDIVGAQARNSALGSPFTASYSGFWRGTSFAAPQVSGVAALIKSINPRYTNKEITAVLLDTADAIDEYNTPELKGLLGKGLVNARRALRASAPATFIPQDPIELSLLQRDNAALWISDSVSQIAKPSALFPVTVTFKNKGGITWQPHLISIVITDLQGKSTLFRGDALGYQNAQNVLPSQAASLSGILTTPKQPGVYKIIFELRYKGAAVRGGKVYKTITVKK